METKTRELIERDAHENHLKSKVRNIRFKKGSVDLAGPKGGKVRTVDALTFNGLAVHKSVNQDGNYTVTHTASGFAVAHAPIQHEARIQAMRLDEIVDFRQDKQTLMREVSNRRLGPTVGKLRQWAYAELWDTLVCGDPCTCKDCR